MYLFNSLTRKKEKFSSQDEQHVKMYACGPTVYDRPHLGNARAAVVYDILFRVLRLKYKKVTYVRNITDVDDKIIAAAQKANTTTKEISKRYEKLYNEDLESIGCLEPTEQPRATEYIKEMINMSQTLIDKGFAYVAENHVLFEVAKYADYGKLSGRTRDEMIAGSRVEIAPFKKDPADFVLWKPSKKGEEDAGFKSPWGHGRPGWHIECSAMSCKLLGETFDIHGGGADLMFPHHENEVAQSVCANNGDFAKFWLHNGFLMVNGQKMSKSLGNFKTVHELLQQGVSGGAIRLAYLSTHYKKPLDFSDKLIQDSENTLKKWQNVLSIKLSGDWEIPSEVVELLEDDLNTPAVLAKCHEYYKENAYQNLASTLTFLGVNWREEKETIIPDDIKKLQEKRDAAKSAKNWALADEIRDELLSKGWRVEDRAGESVLREIEKRQSLSAKN